MVRIQFYARQQQLKSISACCIVENISCRRTPDGSAYPVDIPWGNTGIITGGMCASSIVEKYNLDPDNSSRNRCFLERQMGCDVTYKTTARCRACMHAMWSPCARYRSYMHARLSQVHV